MGGVIISLLLSQIIPIFKINWMFPFFLTGYLCSNKLDLIKKQKYLLFTISSIIFIVLLAIYNKEWIENLSSIKSQIIEGHLSIINKILGIQLFRYLIGFSGSVSLISLIFILTNKYKDSKILTLMGKYGNDTLGIYIFQTLILETIASHYIDLTSINKILFTFIICPIISLCIMWLCLLMHRYLNTNRYTKYLFNIS